jgi:uncharacterized protein (UPF0212 family)
MVEIGLVMGAHPAVIKVRLDAAIGVVEREHLAGVGVDVGVGAGERAVACYLAGQPVDTAMVVGLASLVGLFDGSMTVRKEPERHRPVRVSWPKIESDVVTLHLGGVR